MAGPQVAEVAHKPPLYVLIAYSTPYGLEVRMDLLEVFLRKGKVGQDVSASRALDIGGAVCFLLEARRAGRRSSRPVRCAGVPLRLLRLV